MVLDAHAERVDEDAQENALLEDVVVDSEGEAGSAVGEAGGQGAPARGNTPEHWLLLGRSDHIQVCTKVVDGLLLSAVHTLCQVVCRAIFELFRIKCQLGGGRCGETGGESQKFLAGETWMVASASSVRHAQVHAGGHGEKVGLSLLLRLVDVLVLQVPRQADPDVLKLQLHIQLSIWVVQHGVG